MSSRFEEFIPGGYPVTPQHENTIENVENNNMENNLENSNAVVKPENNDVENKAINDVENKEGNKSVENETKNDVETQPENDVKTQPENDVETQPENDVETQPENGVENKPENDVVNENDVENKTNDVRNNAENDVENKAENKDLENKENKEREHKEEIVNSFPLKFEPNPSMKPTDDNNIAKATTNKGSSALGGIGINPASMLGIGSDSPPHPFYQDKGKSRESDEPKTFDLNGDYNEQKEREQIADQQEQQELQQQQKLKEKEDERIDLGVKPLGNQPLPSPYRPENEGADRPVHKQTEGTKGEMTPPGKATAVHPESQNVGPRITKRDKINATISRAVGTFKQKIGKLVNNDDLVAKGTDKKAEAEKTKELAEVQKKMNEL
ncbi:hypothetical protein RclHR1_01170012 [Rhizophagus clarus]|uniref:Vesicle-associated protein 2-2 isoform X1 n=1 Tax=Rhizophagus clarus TaxID=94130 RepID=A0A2Z6QWR6_9GLOM|nr:hypothetical protein RclHR1_01170012 [Rhizophagus clarus]GES78385.1 vesicle-associated protein 2-2 isoform X1 [Rhizophagus clarus]